MYAPKIMVVEDEERLRKVIVKYLINEGYHVVEAQDGKKALDFFFDQPMDLIILDVMMPEYDGWSVCRTIRKESSEIPIIMLTARSEETDRIFGFELGADDYVTKPFSMKELMMRVKVLLKRTGNRTEDILVIGDIEVHIKSHRVYIKGTEIELSPKEFDLLLYFIQNIDLAVSRESILDKVWGYDYYGDLRTVDTHVKRLRKKISMSKAKIETVRGIGYRFEVK